MNKIYKSVWNASTGAWVAAPETARCAGGAASSLALCEPADAFAASAAWSWAALRPLCLALAVSVAPAWAGTPAVSVAPPTASVAPPPANQLPTGGQVVAGQAQISTPNPNTLNVTQSSHQVTRAWLVASISF